MVRRSLSAGTLCSADEALLATPPNRSPAAHLPGLPKTNRTKAVELFCGHAGLSAAFRQKGFDIVPVDWSGNRHQSVVPIVRLDLTSSEGNDFVANLFQEGAVAVLWMAPPCGTFARRLQG